MSLMSEKPDATMETSEFDATLGGAENLPYSANSLKFAASRSVEIAAMTESILRPSKTKLIFQSLPVHMRRRVMSHNSKRLPRKLREGHLEQLKKSGLPPKQKRPSRKHRRRPGNLLEEYNRRQKRYVWLETHIWHAKRFHMIERWGHKIAYAPCDKAFRACYRASSVHCLMQDISYYTPIQICGKTETIQEMFSSLSDCSCGLGICAKAYTNGNREGTVHLFKPNSFPYGYIGKIHYVWVSNSDQNKTLWLFVHPSYTSQVESVLSNQLCESTTNCVQVPQKRRKANISENIQVKVMKGCFNRFRLTGPNSHAVLTHSIQCIQDIEKIKTNEWIASLSNKNPLYLNEKLKYWQDIQLASSPSQLSPRMIIGLIVRDPRLSRPKHRTKARQQNISQVNIECLYNIPKEMSASPLWNINCHDIIKEQRLTNTQYIEHVTKTQLVPGEINVNDPALQSLPVVLIQRPGSQNPEFKKLAYGSGWDIIVPSGYGLPFWQTFIMFGARSGGLRETESLAFEMGECYLPPDSNAGREEEDRIHRELKEKYFRLPPSKRVNYTKLAIRSPFICPWKLLLKDWCGSPVDDFFVLRDRNLLDCLQECISKKKTIPEIKSEENCLVAVSIQMESRGSLKRHALICLPHEGDLFSIKTLFEPHHEDVNEKIRKQKRKEHIKNIKKWRRKRVKMRKNGPVVNVKKVPKRLKHEPSEYVKSMRELWIPSNVTTVRHVAARQTLGYLSQGAFSFTEARSCGVGYLPYKALRHLLSDGFNKVLIRNTSSRKYGLAKVQLIKDV